VLKNKFETKIFKELQKTGIPFKYESEKIPYVLSGHYIPDFVLITKLGKIYVEAKGYFRPEHKRKMIAVKKQHPELDIRLVFYAPNKKYEKWAIKNGFKYSFVSIPKEWINE
jgi:predicted nuclease of restriction endonuclease-like RecB superfamily